MSSSEFTQWKAFDDISPIDGVRMDWNFGMLAWTIVNALGGKSHDLQRHVLTWGPDADPAKTLEQKMMAWARKHNAQLKADQARKET